MKKIPKIFVDFGNADADGRVRLNTIGSLIDMRDNGIIMEEGLQLLLDNNEDLSTNGIAHFSKEEKIWVAIIDWDSL